MQVALDVAPPLEGMRDLVVAAWKTLGRELLEVRGHDRGSGHGGSEDSDGNCYEYSCGYKEDSAIWGYGYTATATRLWLHGYGYTATATAKPTPTGMAMAAFWLRLWLGAELRLLLVSSA